MKSIKQHIKLSQNDTIKLETLSNEHRLVYNHVLDYMKTSKDISLGARALTGNVVSSGMNKTIVVKILRTFKHPLYGKTIRSFKKYKAHDELNKCSVGDVVEIVECRPLSKTKHMVLSRIIEKQA